MTLFALIEDPVDLGIKLLIVNGKALVVTEYIQGGVHGFQRVPRDAVPPLGSRTCALVHVEALPKVMAKIIESDVKNIQMRPVRPKMMERDEQGTLRYAIILDEKELFKQVQIELSKTDDYNDLM